MKYRLVRQLLIHSVRNLKTMMFAIALAGSISACSRQSSDPSEAGFTNKTDLVRLSAALRGAAHTTEHTRDVEFEQATLVRVVDGNTIMVRIDSDKDYKVRLIGVNATESLAAENHHVGNSIEGMESSNMVKAMLSGINTVYLQKDVSDTDSYGRLLRYVWLELPEDPYDRGEVSGKMLNAILLRVGIAEASGYVPDTTYSVYFEEMEED